MTGSSSKEKTLTLYELDNFPGEWGKISIPREISTSYRTFGLQLLQDKSGSRVEAQVHKYRGNPYDINLEILRMWLKGEGKKPVNWDTLVGVIRDIGHGKYRAF